MPSPIPFWSKDPSILLNKDYIFELWPTSKMSYEQKLNAISRLIILLTVLGFIFTMSARILVIGIITLIVVFILFKSSKQKVTKEMFKEGFSDNNAIVTGGTLTNPETLEQFLKTDFMPNTKTNPFANVLLTEIGDDPNRKSAPPAFNPDVHEDITTSTKKMVQRLNPTIKNTNKQLFGNLGDQFDLDQSNRNFYSTANTRVVNDQGAYADFLYGNMPSSKDANAAGAMERVKDSYRYTLY